MTTSNSKSFTQSKGFLGYLHFLIFPIDLFSQDNEEFEASREQRFNELTPILCWLIPLIVFLSSTTELSFPGLLILFGLEVIILTLLSIIYCWRASIGFIIETSINYAVSFFLICLMFLIFSIIIAPCGIIGIVVIAVFLFQFLSKKGDNSSFDDDDW